MTVNTYDLDLTDEEVEERKKFGDYHKRFSHAIDYPPFSIDQEMRQKFIMRIREAGKPYPPDNDLFAAIGEDYEDQIEEAEMYRKRYGYETFEAQKAAAKLEKLKISDPKVARLSMDYNYNES